MQTVRKTVEAVTDALETYEATFGHGLSMHALQPYFDAYGYTTDAVLAAAREALAVAGARQA